MSDLPAASPWSRLAPLLRTHAVLLVVLLLQVGHACLVWFSGSLQGYWTHECSVGQIAYDLINGLNPMMSVHDLYDRWTTGYLVSGVMTVPLSLLPVSPIYGVKLTALVVMTATSVLAYTLVWRTAGPSAARLGIVGLAIVPPGARYYALLGGNYHFTCLFFELAVALLAVEVFLHGRRSGPWYLALGLTAGLTLTNYPGSAAAVALVGLLWWVLARREILRPAFWLAPLGGLVGLAPFLWKLWFHDPYGLGGGPPGRGGFYVQGGRDFRMVAEKILSFPSHYADQAGFYEGLPWLDWTMAEGLEWTFTALPFLAWAVVLWSARSGLLSLARGALPWSTTPLDERARGDLAAAMPALLVLVFLAAYVWSDQNTSPEGFPWTQHRDVRFLTPVVCLLGLNMGVFAARFPWRLGPVSLSGAAVAVVWLLGLITWPGMVDWQALRTSEGIPYRGTCTSLHGFFASAYLPDIDGHQTGGLWQASSFCAGFPADQQSDCFRGRAWSIGMKYGDGFDDGGPGRQMLSAACNALPNNGLQRDCYRQVGWALNWHALHHFEERHAHLRDYCGQIAEGVRQQWCIEGGGFWFGDHYGFAPERFADLTAWVEPAEDRLSTIRGVGYYLAHAYDDPDRAAHQCWRFSGQGEGFEQACREGAVMGYQVYQRAFPPWEGWGYP